MHWVPEFAELIDQGGRGLQDVLAVLLPPIEVCYDPVTRFFFCDFESGLDGIDGADPDCGDYGLDCEASILAPNHSPRCLISVVRWSV
jgi:hypothetical protein